MSWLAVDLNGSEGIFEDKPRRTKSFLYDDISEWGDIWYNNEYDYDTRIELPKGSIKKLIGRNLTWKDEPVELK